MKFLSLLLCALSQCVKVQLTSLLRSKTDSHKNLNITLRELQSLVGSLNFLCVDVAPGRAFIRQLSFLTCTCLGIKSGLIKVHLMIYICG